MSDIETKVRRRSDVIGLAIGERPVGLKHTDNFRVYRTLYDPTTGAVFAESPDYWGLLSVLWRLPNISARTPRPSVEALVREIAKRLGYGVLVQPSNANAQISFTNQQGLPVAGAPFWMESLRVVLRLPSIAPAQRPAPNAQPRNHAPPPVPVKDPSLDADNARRAELDAMSEEDRAEVESEEERMGPCNGCGGRGCFLCDPPQAA